MFHVSCFMFQEVTILHKLRNQPEYIRKIILFSIVIILGLALLGGFINNLRQRLKELEGEGLMEELKLPELKEELRGTPEIEMPKIEIPEISGEKLEKLDGMSEETEQQE